MHVPPIVASARLVMGDLDGHAPFLADPDGFRHGIEQAGGFVSHVRRVESASALELFGELDHLFRSGIASRFVDEARAEPDGPSLHAFSYPRAHLLELRSR